MTHCSRRRCFAWAHGSPPACCCARWLAAPHDAGRRLRARRLRLGALYVLSYLPLGVASEFRYVYWAVLASAAGLSGCPASAKMMLRSVAPPEGIDRLMTDTAATIQPANFTTLLRGTARRAPAAADHRHRAVRLPHQPFPQPRDGQHLARRDGRGAQHPSQYLAASQPGKAIFYLAALVHTALGIWMLYERRQFRYGAIEGHAARAGPEHSGADHRPRRRCAAGLRSVRQREILLAAVRVLHHVASVHDAAPVSWC